MHDVPGGAHQDRSGLVGVEAAQGWNASGDRDGEFQGEEGFAALGLAADDADGLAAPEPVDQPLLRLGALLQGWSGFRSGSPSTACSGGLGGGLAPGLDEEPFVEEFAVVLGGGEQAIGHDGERHTGAGRPLW